MRLRGYLWFAVVLGCGGSDGSLDSDGSGETGVTESATASMSTTSSGETGSETTSGSDESSESSTGGESSTGAPITCGNGILEPPELCYEGPFLVLWTGGLPTGDILLADFDNDDNLDVTWATATPLPAHTEGFFNSKGYDISVYVALGDGLGGFGDQYDIVGDQGTGDGRPWGMVTSDFDQDGNLDLAFGDESGLDVLVWTGDGTGQFAIDAPYPIGGTMGDLAVADRNGDGRDDLVAAVQWDHGAAVALGLPNGGFAAPDIVLLPDTTKAVGVGDLDGDDAVDVAIGHNSGAVTVLLDDGGGGLAVDQVYDLDGYADDLAVADLDLDGSLDVALVDGDAQLHVMRGDGAGGFPAIEAYPIGDRGRVAVANCNGDEHPDVIAGQSEAEHVIDVLVGAGAGVLDDPVSYGGNEGTVGLAVGDLNGDTIDDFVAVGWQDDIHVFLSNP